MVIGIGLEWRRRAAVAPIERKAADIIGLYLSLPQHAAGRGKESQDPKSVSIRYQHRISYHLAEPEDAAKIATD
jgi:hypothetical protein